jgi:hypothetical protein
MAVAERVLGATGGCQFAYDREVCAAGVVRGLMLGLFLTALVLCISDRSILAADSSAAGDLSIVSGRRSDSSKTRRQLSVIVPKPMRSGSESSSTN